MTRAFPGRAGSIYTRARRLPPAHRHLAFAPPLDQLLGVVKSRASSELPTLRLLRRNASATSRRYGMTQPAQSATPMPGKPREARRNDLRTVAGQTGLRRRRRRYAGEV